VKVLARDGFGAPLNTWVAGVSRSLQALGSARVPVLLIDDVPVINEQTVPCRFGAFLPLQCSAARSEIDRLQGPVRTAIDTVAAKTSDVRTLNLDSLFCTRSTRSAVQHGKLMYFDNQHLSAAGSRYVSHQIRWGMLAAVRTGTSGRS
jgi:SGNH domain (fused to AT3 domains)